MNTPDPELAIQHEELVKKDAALTVDENLATLSNFIIDSMAESISALTGRSRIEIKQMHYAAAYALLRPAQRVGVEQPK